MLNRSCTVYVFRYVLVDIAIIKSSHSWVIWSIRVPSYRIFMEHTGNGLMATLPYFLSNSFIIHSVRLLLNEWYSWLKSIFSLFDWPCFDTAAAPTYSGEIILMSRCCCWKACDLRVLSPELHIVYESAKEEAETHNLFIFFLLKPKPTAIYTWMI